MDEIKLSGSVRNNQRLSGEINSEQELLGILNRSGSGSAKEFFYINMVWHSNDLITITDQDMTIDKMIQAVDSGLFPIIVVDVSEIISGGGISYVYYKFDCVDKSNKFLLFSTLINYDQSYLNRTIDTIKIYEDDGSIIINSYSSIRSFINSLISTALNPIITSLNGKLDMLLFPSGVSSTFRYLYSLDVNNNPVLSLALTYDSRESYMKDTIPRRHVTNGHLYELDIPESGTPSGHWVANKNYVDSKAKNYVLYGETNPPTPNKNNNFKGQIYVRVYYNSLDTDVEDVDIYACHGDHVSENLYWKLVSSTRQYVEQQKTVDTQPDIVNPFPGQICMVYSSGMTFSSIYIYTTYGWIKIH